MHTKGQANLFKLVGGPFVRGPHLITDMNVKRIMAYVVPNINLLYLLFCMQTVLLTALHQHYPIMIIAMAIDRYLSIDNTVQYIKTCSSRVRNAQFFSQITHFLEIRHVFCDEHEK